MRTLGADISHWEGIIDWITAARWLPFVYYKCTDGEHDVDATFARNKEGCTITGMPHACYHWFQPEQDPIKQADHFVDTAGDGYCRYIVDVEQQPKDKIHFPLTVHTFLKQVEKRTGIKPAIYTSAGFWNPNMKPKPLWSKDYELIVAHYTIDAEPVLPIGWTRYVIWQHSKLFFFPGCDAAADGDWFAGSLAECRQWFGNYRPVDLPAPGFQYKSLFDQLHVRQQPSKTSREVGHLAKGQQVQVNELGGKDVWIKHDQGWTAVEIDGYRYMEVVR